jgi:conjugal transfer pilin signal peptidase TrbI
MLNRNTLAADESRVVQQRRYRSGNRRVVVLGVLLGIIASVEALAVGFRTRYWIAVDGEKGEHCLRYSVFLVDSHDLRIGRGDYVAFVSRHMAPFYPDGIRVVKIVTAVAGDHVVVDANGVSINGTRSGELLHVQPGQRLWRMGQRAVDFARDERVPAHRWWVMGTSPRSFDARYWGYITDEQIIGRARPLW